MGLRKGQERQVRALDLPDTQSPCAFHKQLSVCLEEIAPEEADFCSLKLPLFGALCGWFFLLKHQCEEAEG